ncbi:MAG: hypothetical protein ABEK17_03395 [Candidatus Aenigmatarchaeota archaeon]
MKNKRIEISLISGALLGVICIFGVGLRMGFEGNYAFLFSLWYNRLLMGFVIGIASGLKIIKSDKNFLVRGLLIGLLVTFAHSFTTQFADFPSFFAGIIYGIVIDFIATKYE